MEIKKEPTIDIYNLSESSPLEGPNYFNCSKTLATYYCDYCVFNTQLLVDLKQHTHKHTPIRTYHKIRLHSCDQCSHKTHSILMLFNHYLSDHRSYVKRKWFKCKECIFFTGNSFSLTCTECSFTTNWRSRLEKHMSVHTPDSQLWVKCSFCRFKTQHQSSLRRHVRASHISVENIQLFQCAVCHHKTVRSDHMKRHMKEVHSCFFYQIQRDVRVKVQTPDFSGKDKYFVCQWCPWKTLSEACLQGHIRELHNGWTLKEEEQKECEIPKVLASGCPEKCCKGHDPFLCSFCAGHNMYQCVFCPVKTISRRNLSKHIEKEHESNDKEKVTEPQSFHCDQCSFSTEWMNTLKLHNLLKHRKKDLLMNLIST